MYHFSEQASAHCVPVGPETEAGVRGHGLPDTRLRPHQAEGGRVHYPPGGGKEQQRHQGQEGRAIRAQVHRGRSCPRQSNGKLDTFMLEVTDVALLQG
jgi:hypothetical protein